MKKQTKIILVTATAAVCLISLITILFVFVGRNRGSSAGAERESTGDNISVPELSDTEATKEREDLEPTSGKTALTEDKEAAKETPGEKMSGTESASEEFGAGKKTGTKTEEAGKAEEPGTKAEEPGTKADEAGTKVEVTGTAEETGLLNASTVGENSSVTYGIDVSKYQGTIDWSVVASEGIEFAMIRIGYRDPSSGYIGADSTSEYNLKEAQKNGLKIGVYFFSTAASEDEAREEADWVANYISEYSVTYPVAYDCEGYGKESSRQFSLTKEERSNIAMAFMDRIYQNGYTPMIYGDAKVFKDDAGWTASAMETKYKMWVAIYDQDISHPENKPAYDGRCSMWQYSNHGRINGIPAEVDLDVAYFGYDGTEQPKKIQ